MAPSAPRDDPRPARGVAAAAKSDTAAANGAAAAVAAAHRDSPDDIPNGIIVKKIPEGLFLLLFIPFHSEEAFGSNACRLQACV
jgi:hypothetical protein